MKKYIVILIGVLMFSCENAYDKEDRYIEKINSKFYESLDPNLKHFFTRRNLPKISCEIYIDSKSKICPIKKGFDEKYKRTVKINHFLSKELLKKGFNLSYDLDEIEYFIFTDIDMEKAGTYVDKNGNKSEDAHIVTDLLYLYNLKSKKLCLITSHRGKDPKQRISRGNKRYESSSGKHWSAEDHLKYLIDNGYLIKNKDFTEIYSIYADKYVDFLEKNDFYGIKF